MDDAAKGSAPRENNSVGNGRDNSHVAIFLLIQLGICVLLTLFDTAMAYHLKEALLYSQDGLWMMLPVVLMAFLLQTWFKRLKKHGFVRWILPCISALGLVLTELLMLGNLLMELLTYFAWGITLPLLMGLLLAEVPDFIKAKRRRIRIAALSLTAVAFAIAILFWPRYFSGKAELSPDTRLMYYAPEGERSFMRAQEDEGFLQVIKWMRVTPCLFPPQWGEDSGVLLRLNDGYVLAAGRQSPPVIYEYTGELEHFSGETPRFSVYGYPTLYIELFTRAQWEESGNE